MLSTPDISSALFPLLFGNVSALQVSFAVSSSAPGAFNSWERMNSISGFTVWMVLNGSCVWRDTAAMAAKLSIIGGLDASEGQCHFCFIPCEPKAGTVSSAESGTHFFSPCFAFFLLPFALLPSLRLRPKVSSLQSPFSFLWVATLSLCPADHTTSLPHDFSPWGRQLSLPKSRMRLSGQRALF